MRKKANTRNYKPDALNDDRLFSSKNCDFYHRKEKFSKYYRQLTLIILTNLLNNMIYISLIDYINQRGGERINAKVVIKK
jgi:hypothetical protein